MNLLLGTGNTLKGDDAIGIWVANNFHYKHWICINCGTTPENFTALVKKYKPHILVIVDAVEMGLPPGSVRRIRKHKISNVGIGTHTMPLSLLISYLEPYAYRIIFLGVQFKTQVLGEPMCEEVKRAGKRIIDILREGSWEEVEVV